MTSARVAIITRTKDRPILLDRCLRTVLAQTFADWIHVIVNDGGDAETLERVVSARRPDYSGRLQVLTHPASLGMEAASNAGIRASDSRFIAILDDDDSWDPAFLSELVRTLERRATPEIRGAFCHTDIVKEEIRSGGEVVELSRRSLNGHIEHIDLLQLAASNKFMPVSFLFERQVLDEIGDFDESLPVCGDWEFHLRFLARYDIAVVPRPLARYHQRPSARGAYGNSITAAQQQHRAQRAVLANRWIREGLRSGRISMAELFALGTTLETAERIEVLIEKLDRRRHPLRSLGRAVRRWFVGGPDHPRR